MSYLHSKLLIAIIAIVSILFAQIASSQQLDGTQERPPRPDNELSSEAQTEAQSDEIAVEQNENEEPDDVPSSELASSPTAATDAETQKALNESADALIVVVGAGGKSEYQIEFDEWADQWQQLAKRQRWPLQLIRKDADQKETPKERLQFAIQSFAERPRLWVILIGHGTYASGKAKFNLPGPDITSKELSGWLDESQGQVIAINCSSSSSPFVSDIATANRIVVTATRSGNEVNFSRFGRFMSKAVNDLSIDIDHDKEVSLLEAFLAATAQTERFYKEDARLTTEHALLDDNGDKAGITADFYRGVRPVKKAKDNTPIDGSVAARVIVMTSEDSPTFSEEMNQKRLSIESQIDQLRLRRQRMIESEYLDELEKLMLQMAEVYQTVESNSGNNPQ